MKDDLDRTGMKIDKNGKNLHALECATGCTSWICNGCICFGPLAQQLLFIPTNLMIIPVIKVQ